MLETNRFVLLNVDTIDGLQLSLLHGLAYDLSLQPKLKWSLTVWNYPTQTTVQFDLG